MSKRAPPVVRVTQRLVGDGQTKDEVIRTWALLLAKAVTRKVEHTFHPDPAAVERALRILAHHAAQRREKPPEATPSPPPQRRRPRGA